MKKFLTALILFFVPFMIFATDDIIGTVKDLQRTMIDDISIDECDELDDVLNGKYHTHDLLDVLSKRYKQYDVANIEDIMNGKRIKINSNEEKLIIVHDSKLLAMYQKDGNEYKCIRGLW